MGTSWKDATMWRVFWRPTRRETIRPALAALAMLLLVGSAASAQNDAGRDLARQDRLQQLLQYEMDTRYAANPEIPAGQRALIDVGGYFSPQFFSVDDANQNNHGLREYDLVAYLRANFDGVNEVFMRGRAQYNDYNAGDSFDGFGSRLINPDFDRIYYKFDLKNDLAAYHGSRINGDVVFEGGRDLVYWGNGLVIGKVIDGVMPTFSLGNVSLAAIAGVTPTRTVDFEPDRPAFDHNTRRGFYGGLLSVTLGEQHPYVYGLVQQDYNNKNESLIGPIDTKYDYNSNYIGIGSTGALSDHWRYGLEMVYESGKSISDSSTVSGFVLSPVMQTRDRIAAYAMDAKVDYVPQDYHNSRVSLEFIAASGDSDRGLTDTTFNGNAPNTADRAFNGFGILNTGLGFGAAPSNLLALRVGPSTFPFPDNSRLRRFQIGTDLQFFGKTNPDAPIDEATKPGAQYLGWEPDIYINWEISSDITFALRYGVFLPNPGAFNNDSARQFLYAGATFAF
jgi:hypothetical protein